MQDTGLATAMKLAKDFLTLLKRGGVKYHLCEDMSDNSAESFVYICCH